MNNLFVAAFSNLMRFDLHLYRGNFASLHKAVRSFPVRPIVDTHEMGTLCHTMDLACICYWKEVLCLQRSAATTCLLRYHGFRAQLVVGAQHLPFKAHAWVEIEGYVVNDRPYVSDIYHVLDRC